MALQAAKKIYIGWASRDVTPQRPVNLMGQFHPRIATTARDPVTVTALALAAGKAAADYAIFVSADTAIINQGIREQCQRAVKARLPKLDISKIVLNATHTHTAPQLFEGWYPPQGPEVMTPAAYGDFFVERVADAVAEAWQTKKPGGASWGFGYAVAGHSRRVVYFDDLSKRPDAKPFPGGYTNGTAAMYGKTADAQFSHMEGYVDHSLDLLFMWDRKKQLTGLLINLPCPSQETEGESKISADFWHDIRLEIRRRHGKDMFILPQCSAAGDLSPHPLLHRVAEERMLKLKGLSRREEIARRVAQAVDEVLPCAAKEIATSLPFRHIVKTILLPRRMVTPAEYEAVKANYDRLEKEYAAKPDAPVRVSTTTRCREILERYREQKHAPNLPEELHVIRLGDIAFATNRFELFLDYGLRIKARSKALQTFVVQLAAGFTRSSYLPTARAISGGGYSAGIFDNAIGAEGGQVLVEETVGTIASLWEK